MDRIAENICSTLNIKMELPNSEVSNHVLTELNSTVKVGCPTSQPVKISQLYGLSKSANITKSTGQKGRQPERIRLSKVGEKKVCRNLNFTFENTLRSVSKRNNNNIVQAECGKSVPERVSHLPGPAKVNNKKCEASTPKKRQPERLARNKKNITIHEEDENHAPNINKKSKIGEQNVCQNLNSAFKNTVQTKLDVDKSKIQRFGNVHRTMRNSFLIPPGTIKDVLIKKRLEENKIISQVANSSTIPESLPVQQRAQQHTSEVLKDNEPFMSRVDVQSHSEELVSTDAYDAVLFSDKEDFSNKNAIDGPYNAENISSMSLSKEIDKSAQVCFPTEQSDTTQKAGLEVNVKTLKNTNCKVGIDDTNPAFLLHYLKHYIHNIDQCVTKLKHLLPHLEEIEYSNTSNKIVPGIIPQCTEMVDKEIQVNSCCQNLDMDNARMATNNLNNHIPDIVISPININSIDNHLESSGIKEEMKDDREDLNNKCDLEKPHENSTPQSLENKSVNNDSFLKLENDLCITQNNSDSPCKLNTLSRGTKCPEDCTQAFKHYMALKSSMCTLETPKCLTRKLPVSDTHISDKSRISSRVLKALEILYMD